MNIAIYSLIAWDFINQRPHAFARELARFGHEILYVEPSDFDDGFQSWLDRHLKGEFHSYEAEEGIQILEGGLIPMRSNYRDLFHHNESLAAAYAEKLTEYDLDFALVLAPEYVSVLDRLRIPFAYDHVDDTQYMDGIDTSMFVETMERLKAQAAFNIYIQEPAADQDAKGFFLPNGIDTHIFTPFERPKLFDGVVLSAIAKWFDIDSVIRSNSPLLLIGPMDHDLGDNHQRFFAAQRPNLHWIPQVDKQTANLWLSSAKVGLVPFKTSHPVVPYAMPIKILEYFLAGLPVVTYRSEGIERFYGDRVVFYSPDGRMDPILDEAIRIAIKDQRDHRPFALQFNWPDLVRRLERRIVDVFSTVASDSTNAALARKKGQRGGVDAGRAEKPDTRSSPTAQNGSRAKTPIPGEDEEAVRTRLAEMRKLLQDRTLWATHVDQEVRYQMGLVEELRKELKDRDVLIRRQTWELEATNRRLPTALRSNSVSSPVPGNPHQELENIRKQWWFKVLSPGLHGWLALLKDLFSRGARTHRSAPVD